MPQRGDKRQLLETVTRNAQEEFTRHRLRRASDHNSRAQALNELRDALGLPEAPLRIECFDMSHIQGTDYVGSMVVVTDGLADKREYRRFKVEAGAWESFAERLRGEGARLAAGHGGTLFGVWRGQIGLEANEGIALTAWPDEESLAASSGRLAKVEVGTDRLRFTTQPFQAGEVIELRIPVSPAFAGRLSTPPLVLRSSSGAEVALPPQTWVIGGPAGS